jgi:hypothetical protein
LRFRLPRRSFGSLSCRRALEAALILAGGAD